MAKKRFCNIEIWDKSWFMELSPKLKCLVRYIYDKCDCTGVWVPNWKLVSVHINDSISEADLKLLPPDQFEILQGDKIFLPEFINFQYGVLSEQCMAHKPVFATLKKNNLSNRVFNRVSDTLLDKEKEKDIEKEMDMEKETEIKKEEKPKNNQKGETESGKPKSELELKFEAFILFRKKLKKPVLEESLQALKDRLWSISDKNEQSAIEIINQSIANGWQGLFKLKTENENLKPKNHGKRDRNSDKSDLQELLRNAYPNS